MSEMPAKLTPEKCPCGHASCNDWGFAEGKFFQGNGFSREVAEEIARRYNEYEERKESHEWLRDAYRNLRKELGR